MIPIKKLKAQVVAEFKTHCVLMEIKIRTARNLTRHYLAVPFGISTGGVATVRWNIKRQRFDRITFVAFGKAHRIKL